jgi:hypothetical protein
MITFLLNLMLICPRLVEIGGLEFPTPRSCTIASCELLPSRDWITRYTLTVDYRGLSVDEQSLPLNLWQMSLVQWGEKHDD